MSDAKHTPGPWRFPLSLIPEDVQEQMREQGMAVDRYTDNDGSVRVLGQEGPVAVVCVRADIPARKRYQCEDPERDANAHLIAAAPDMFEALEALLSEEWGEPTKEMWEAARAAISKARGEQ